uniref:Uncharacterized protein n=1 Tax=Arundo donax TaxID=35708 RepID=A0A0A8ZD57_ARUDO
MAMCIHVFLFTELVTL